MYADIVIVVPTELDEKAKSALRSLEAAYREDPRKKAFGR
jgi:hypothetical protein